MALGSTLLSLSTSAARVARRRLTRGPLRKGWPFGFEVFADWLRRTAVDIELLPTTEQGAAWENVGVPNPVLKKVRFEQVSARGVPAYWVTPVDGPAPERTLLYLHGGYYSSNSVNNVRELLARLCLAASARALALDYRLAPAHPFPAAVEDALTGWRWLRSTGALPSTVVPMGDSAGGGLTAALLLSLRDSGETLPPAAVLLCPWVDLAAEGGSLVENAAYDYLRPDAVPRRAKLYLGDTDAKNALASPAYADLRGLPPMLVQVGSAEMFYDQVVRFAERARAAGVDVALDVGADMIHVWQLLAAFFRQSREAIARVGAFVRERT